MFYLYSKSILIVSISNLLSVGQIAVLIIKIGGLVIAMNLNAKG